MNKTAQLIGALAATVFVAGTAGYWTRLADRLEVPTGTAISRQREPDPPPPPPTKKINWFAIRKMPPDPPMPKPKPKRSDARLA